MKRLNSTKILFLGNSSIFQRKIHPSVKKFKNISIELATSRKIKLNTKLKIYKSYKESIEKSNASIVYVSLINSEHFKWAHYALKNYKHVIVDKPLALELKQTKSLINLAKKNKLFLSEAVVFHKHSRFKKFLLKLNFKSKINVKAYFHIPKLEKKNFRNYKKFGGGCFNDMSSYAAYLIHLFIGKKKYKIDKDKKNKNFYKHFTINAKSQKIRITASFKFNSNYKNQIIVDNNQKKYFIEFAFSPPIDKSTYMTVINDNKKKYTLNFRKQNTFDIYFSEVFSLIKNKKYNFFYNEIETIAKIKKNIF
jgi:predicted dehydrogenase